MDAPAGTDGVMSDTPKDWRAEWINRFIEAFDRELELAEEVRHAGQPFSKNDFREAAMRVIRRGDWYPRGRGEQ